MSEDLLRRIAAELNGVPQTPEFAARSAALVADTNRRISDAAKEMPFDSSPHAFQHWLAAMDQP